MSFPSVIGTGKYSIVKLSVVPSYAYSDVPSILKEYAFVFETFYSNDKTKNGWTNVDIVPIDTLSIFNIHVEGASKFNYAGGNLVINEFIEIVEERDEYAKRYIAVLKNQISKNKQYVRDIRILLCTDNNVGDKCLDNIPIVQLGPEFEAKVNYHKENGKLKMISNTKRFLSMKKHYNCSENDKIIIDKCLGVVKKEYELQEEKVERIFEDYLQKTRFIQDK